MEYMVFTSTKSGNRVVVPASMAMVIQRPESVVVYAIGGNGKDRMVWELPKLEDISICHSMSEALKVSS